MIKRALALWLACAAIAFSQEQWPGEPTVSPRESDVMQRAANVAETNLVQAVALLEDATTDESSAALDFALGVLNRRRHELALAVSNFREALRKKPDFQRARAQLAFVLCLRGEHESAQKALRALDAAGAPSPIGWALLGQSLLEKKVYSGAEEAYRHAIGLDNQLPEALYGLARTFLAQERHDMALGVLDELTRAAPFNAGTWSLRVNCLIALDRPGKALATLETARRLNLLVADDLMLLGDLYFNEQVYTEAASAYVSAFSAGDPGIDRVLRALQAFATTGQSKEAYHLLKLLKNDPRTRTRQQQCRMQRIEAELQYGAGETETAIAGLEAALKANPLNAEILLKLADWIRERGNLIRAETLYKRAADLEGAGAPAAEGLANIAIEREDYALAARFLENAQLLDPSPSRGRLLESVRRLDALKE